MKKIVLILAICLTVNLVYGNNNIKYLNKSIFLYHRQRRIVPSRIYFYLSKYFNKCRLFNKSIQSLKIIYNGNYKNKYRIDALRRIVHIYNKKRDCYNFKKLALRYIKANNNFFENGY